MKLTRTIPKIVIRYIALFAYIATLVFGNGIHIHSALTLHDKITVHVHEATSNDQPDHVSFHHFEGHHHFVATVYLTATQTRINTIQCSFAKQLSPESIFVTTVFLLYHQSLPQQHFDSRQYAPLDGTSFHSSGSDPPFSHLS